MEKFPSGENKVLEKDSKTESDFFVPENQSSVEIIKNTLNDERSLEEVRISLGISMKEKKEERKGWKINFKPRNEWREEKEITTDHPIDKLKQLFKSFSKEEREKTNINKENIEQLQEDRGKFPEVEFDYKTGIGVEGRVGGEVGILAKGFYECSGLVFQSKDKVAVIHISPSTIRGTSSGGEIVTDQNIYGHIGSALKDFAFDSKDVRKTRGDIELSKDEIQKLQEMIDKGELKTTMLAGEDQFVPGTVAIELSGQTAKGHNLPFIRPDVHYVGNLTSGKGYSIYANPNNLYFIGSNGAVLKNGKNFPPMMYGYNE